MNSIERKSKDEYYADIALAVSKRGTCLRRNYGAIIVKDDEIIASGYTGAPRGMKNCCDCGICERERLNIKSGERYELCKSVHAEQNAIISASRKDMLDGTLYLAGIDMKTDKVLDAAPCKLCWRFIINAGIETVKALRSDGSILISPVTSVLLSDILGGDANGI